MECCLIDDHRQTLRNAVDKDQCLRAACGSSTFASCSPPILLVLNSGA